MSKERTAARQSPRLEVSLAAHLLSLATGAPPIPVTTRDLGPNGALCESGTSVAEGESYSFSVTLPASGRGQAETIALPAKVVRVEGVAPYAIALQFSPRPERSVEALKRFVWRARGSAGR
jgi:hypothetical protein